MTPRRPAAETLVVPGCDRCDARTGPAPPSDFLSHCMFPGSACATRPRTDGRVPPRYSWVRPLAHRENPQRLAFPLHTPGKRPGFVLLCGVLPSAEHGNAPTRPATAPLSVALYSYDTAVGAQRGSAHQSVRSPPPHALRARGPCESDAPGNSGATPASIDRPNSHHSPGCPPSSQSAAQTRLWSDSGGSGSRPPAGFAITHSQCRSPCISQEVSSM